MSQCSWCGSAEQQGPSDPGTATACGADRRHASATGLEITEEQQVPSGPVLATDLLALDEKARNPQKHDRSKTTVVQGARVGRVLKTLEGALMK